MSEWDNIEGLEGWRKKLEELLKEAEEAAQNADIDARLALNNRLAEYIVRSTPNTPEIMDLDALAEKARSDLMLLTIEERLAGITSRTGEFARLTKEFKARAATTKAAAASVRLERAHRVVDSLTESIRTLKEFRMLLEAGKDEELATNLDRVISSIQKLRNTVEGVD